MYKLAQSVQEKKKKQEGKTGNGRSELLWSQNPVEVGSGHGSIHFLFLKLRSSVSNLSSFTTTSSTPDRDKGSPKDREGCRSKGERVSRWRSRFWFKGTFLLSSSFLTENTSFYTTKPPNLKTATQRQASKLVQVKGQLGTVWDQFGFRSEGRGLQETNLIVKSIQVFKKKLYWECCEVHMF